MPTRCYDAPAWRSGAADVLLLVIAVGDKLNFFFVFTPRK
jgi:hypothetical protein